MKVTARLLAAAAASAILLGAGAGASAQIIKTPPEKKADSKKEEKKDEKGPERKVSGKASKPLKAAKDAADAKKYPEALDKLKEVEGIADKTDYDTHVMNELYG